MPENRSTLSHVRGAALDRQIRESFDAPMATCAVEAGAEASDVREVTVRVVDRNGEPWPGIWAILLYLSSAKDSLPTTSQTLSAAVEGEVLSTLQSNTALLAITGESGVFRIEVEVAGAGERFVHSSVLGPMKSSRSIAWA